MPDEDEIEGAKSRYTLIVNLARSENLTVCELITGAMLRGHYGLPRPVSRYTRVPVAR